MSFPRYEAYKDINVQWIGEVPSHWESRPLWTLFRRTKRTGHEEEQLLSVYRDYGVVPKASRDDNFNKPSDDLTTYQLVNPGDLAINKMKAWQGSVAVSEYRGIVSPAYFVFEAQHQEDPKFLHYLLRSAEYTAGYLSISKGIRPNQWDLEPQEHSRMPVLLPPIREQAAIAAFLDDETSKIDALVEEQKQLIKLLTEKRQAVISHAVTKGLEPGAAMKDSGIEWLGDIPEHWVVRRLKAETLLIEQGWSPQCEATAAESDDDWGVLKVGCVNRGTFNPHENKALPSELEPRPELGLKVGDLLISRANTREWVGSAAVVEADYPRLLLCDKLYRLRLNGASCQPSFVAHYLGTPGVRQQIELAATGASSSMLNIGQATILELPIVLPPVDEQSAIVDWISDQAARLDELATSAEAAIALLQERRSALISAAVTGKIDVRGLVPNQAEAA